MKYKFFTLVVFAVFLSRAQLAAVDDVTIQTSIRSIGFGADVGRVQIGESASGESFTVQSFQIGEPVKYVGPPQVTFYGSPYSAPVREEFEDFLLRIEAALPKKKETTSVDSVPVPIAQVQLNSAWKKTLLVWIGRGDGYGILAMPDDNADFPIDHVRFVNLTPRRIGILISENEKKLTLPADDWVISANGREAIYFTAILENPEGESKRISNVVEMRTGVRRTVFFAVANYAAMGGDPTGGPQFSYFVLTER